MSVTFNKGFPELSLRSLQRFDGRTPAAERPAGDDLHARLKELDANGDGRIQIGELVQANDPELAQRYMRATARITGRYGPKSPRTGVGMATGIGLSLASAGLAVAQSIHIGTSLFNGNPSSGLKFALFVAPLTIALAQGISSNLLPPAIRKAEDAVAKFRARFSEDHKALQQLLSPERMDAVRTRVVAEST